MPQSDPLSLGILGVILAVGGLVTLMLGERPNPQSLAAASACLVGALLAFAVDALLRLRREAMAARAARTAPAAAQAAPSIAVTGPEPAAAAPKAQPHQTVLASVRIRRGTRSR